METKVDIDVEVNDFLEHFGIRGMKWGIRKANLNESNYDVGVARERLRVAKAQRHEDRTALIKTGVSYAAKTAAVVAVGAGVAGMLLRRHGSRPVSDIVPNYSSPFKMVRGAVIVKVKH